jgi:hypothetical protein
VVKVRDFDNETEAQLARDFLTSKGIPAHLVGTKEYTAHILGGGAGHFDLMVDPINLILSRNLLSSLAATEPTDPLPINHFRRAVFYGLLGAIVLPIVFNYASLVQARHFWRNSPHDASATVKLVIILLLQTLPLFVAYRLLHS